MDEALRKQLMASFWAYLEEAADPREGDLAEVTEAGPDLFTLLAELSALKGEVKLESRQVKSALDQFRELFETMREREERLEEERARRREAERTSSQRAHKDLLLELLELRDRLEAGHQQALRFRPGWLGRRRARAFVGPMGEGMAMNLRRLDESLARRGVRPMSVVGQPFDPRTMHAAELASDPKLPEGLVVAELRKGFLHEDALLRPAEVVVNRPKASREPRPHLNS